MARFDVVVSLSSSLRSRLNFFTDHLAWLNELLLPCLLRRRRQPMQKLSLLFALAAVLCFAALAWGIRSKVNAIPV
jgi:hypothetical protein